MTRALANREGLNHHAVVSWWRQRLGGLGTRWGVVVASAGVTWGLMWLVLQGSARFALAGALVGVLGVASAVRPRVAIVGVLVFTVFLGEIRRLLLYVTGWSGYDPLQMVAPAVVILLVGQLMLSKDRVRQTPLSKMVLALMGVMLIQVFNPLQGGLMVGVAGGLFYIVPLLWFWVGREHTDEGFLGMILLRLVPVLAIFGALMGLYQTFFGFLPHQKEWIDNYGYAALMITAEQARAFSVFNSGQEFATYMLLAMAGVLCGAVAGGRWSWLVLVPLLLMGVFVQGSRGPMIGFVTLVALVWAMTGRDPQWWIPRLAAALVVGLTVGYFVMASVDIGGLDPTLAPIAQHQVDGLTDPFNDKKSTANTHLAMKQNGIIMGFQVPWGLGLGATTLAAGKFGGRGGSTEVDISNMFVSLGLIGGFLYVAIIGYVVVLSLRHWALQRSAVALAVGAVLATVLGQWLSGGMYAVVPLVWLCIGYLDQMVRRESVEHDDVVDPRSPVGS